MNEITPEALSKALKSTKKFSCSFTAKSKITGKDYTFKITTNGDFRNVYVEINYMDWMKLGYYTTTRPFKPKKTRPMLSKSAESIKWLLDRLLSEQFDQLRENVIFYHLGKCLLCGKTLTDAISIERGLGSKCAQF